MNLTWKWYLQYSVMNVAGWLLVFGSLLLLSHYMQEGAMSNIDDDQVVIARP
jgi:hypothetical protein